MTAELKRFVHKFALSERFLLVAFSGGPDSTALLWGLTQIAASARLRLHAAHLDHGLDEDSKRRAIDAQRLASQLNVPCTVERLELLKPSGESSEAFARHHRYAFLQRLANHLGADRIVTAHHREDQAETVLLRLLFGSGLAGLGAMSPVRGPLLRPLLGCRRRELKQALQKSGLKPVEDPTNSDLSVPRNAVRFRLLPHLESLASGTDERPSEHLRNRSDEPPSGQVRRQLCSLATAARRARRRIEQRLEPLLSPRRLAFKIGRRFYGLEIDRKNFETLPEPLLPMALAWLHRQAGAPYPAGAAARRELLRQIQTGAGLGCDCGHGWRWEADSRRLRLITNASSPGRIAYNLSVPGSVDIPELDLRVRLTRGKVASWMYSGRIHRTGLAGADLEASSVVVRNRRPGDRIQPLGSSRRRRLKEVLINRRVPRLERDRLPLLVIDGEIAWVPGVTVGERFRLGRESFAWIAEIEDLQTQSDNPHSPDRTQGDRSTER